MDKLVEMNLDYDPFVNAQDYNVNWIANLEIKKEKCIFSKY
nr:hypothetical protein [Flavobacterium sp. J27]